ncbi:hypothetical protein [Hymenobacter sp. NBH84]|uniref:hypothetical protein n=1 Tax=Hymenobacter sp. NBH84 TaxID=2596915 RepID=UPI00162A6281|nr:hypothetical protein [Hymenobacter sp. NBH84]
MTWPEYEYAVKAHNYKIQRELEGHRLVAVQVFNMLAKKPLKPSEYMRLNLIDGEEKKVNANAESHEEFMARMIANNFYRKPKPKSNDDEK